MALKVSPLESRKNGSDTQNPVPHSPPPIPKVQRVMTANRKIKLARILVPRFMVEIVVFDTINSLQL